MTGFWTTPTLVTPEEVDRARLQLAKMHPTCECVVLIDGIVWVWYFIEWRYAVMRWIKWQVGRFEEEP